MRANADVSVDEGFTYLTDKTAFPSVISISKKPEQCDYAHILDDYFPEAKKILILRNARDVVVSFSEWKKQVIGSLLKAAPRSIAFFMRYLNNWCALHESWLNDVENNPSWLVITYEDMKNDFAGTLKSVFNFLELDANDEFISDLTRKLYGIDNPTYQKENKERGYSFFRKGAIGEWQEKYSWWHKSLYNVFFKSRVDKIYARIDKINK